MHSTKQKRGGACYKRLVRKRDHFHSPTSIHPSDDEYYAYRIETPTTIAAVIKRSRERERDNLLIVQEEEGKRKNFEGEKI